MTSLLRPSCWRPVEATADTLPTRTLVSGYEGTGGLSPHQAQMLNPPRAAQKLAVTQMGHHVAKLMGSICTSPQGEQTQPWEVSWEPTLGGWGERAKQRGIWTSETPRSGSARAAGGGQGCRVWSPPPRGLPSPPRDEAQRNVLVEATGHAPRNAGRGTLGSQLCSLEFFYFLP